MRFLVFNWRDLSHPEAGGAEVFIFKVIEALLKQGHKVDVFCGSFPGAEKTTIYKGARIFRAGNRITTYLLAPIYYLFKLRKRYDVVIDSINGIPWFTPLFVRTKRIAMFYHVVGDIFFKELPFPLACIAYFIERYLIGLLYFRTPFVTISNSTKEELVRLGVVEKNISLSYSGVDQELYHRAKKPATKPRLIFVGRFKRYKRIELLIDIFHLIKKKIPAAELFLVVSPGESEPIVRERIKKYGLPDVHILDFSDKRDKVKLMQTCRLNVSASYKEGWGLTIIEANACGMPSVAFNVPGLNESIVDGKTGLLANSVEGFADHCVRLLNNKTLYEKLSEEAYKWSKTFSWERTTEDMLAALKK